VKTFCFITSTACYSWQWWWWWWWWWTHTKGYDAITQFLG